MGGRGCLVGGGGSTIEGISSYRVSAVGKELCTSESSNFIFGLVMSSIVAPSLKSGGWRDGNKESKFKV